MQDVDIFKQKRTANQKRTIRNWKSIKFERRFSNFSMDSLKIGHKFPLKKKQVFYNDLSILLGSGIDLVSALDLVSQSFKREKDRLFILSIKNDLIKGISLFSCLEKSGCFSIYECYSIKIGEETGTIDKILAELSSYSKGRIAQKRKVVSAFSYPVLVILTAILAMVFMLNFIVPMFEDVFRRFDKDLPYLTKVVIKFADNFSIYLLFFIFLLSILFLVYYVFKGNDFVRKTRSKFVLHTPVFGKLVRKILIARFCLTMELLLGAKNPLINSIQIVRKMFKLYDFDLAFKQIEKEILNGKSLSESMSAFKIFDLRMIALVKVAEEVNQLEQIFKLLKEQYNEEIEHQTNVVSSIMEPLLIVFVGLFVGVILISMYLPIFKISSTFM